MTRNKIMDLNNHLFEQLERLNDLELQGEALEEELKRSDAVAKIASRIIQTGELALRAKQFEENPNKMNIDAKAPEMLEG